MPIFHLFRRQVPQILPAAFDGTTAGQGDTLHRKPASHRVLQKFAYLLSAHWVQEGLQALFIISLARHSATTYGEFMLALTMGEILRFVVEFGFNQHLVSLLVREGNNRSDSLAQVSILKGMLLACGCFVMLIFVHWQDYPAGLQALVFVLGTAVGMEALVSSFFVACEVEGHQNLEGKIKTLGAAMGFGYGFSLLFLGAAPLIVAFYKAIETLTNLAGVLLTAGKGFRGRLRWPRLTQIWTTGRGSIVFTLMAIATILYNKANIFFLQKFGGAAQVAQYSVTWEMVDGIACLISNLLLKNILFPLFVGLWDTDRVELARLVRNAAKWLMAAALPIMFVMFIESDRLIGLIYGPAYGDAVWMQKYLVATIAIGFMHNLAAYLMISMKQEFLLLSFYVGGLLFNLVCCTVLIPANPLLGSVLAIVLTKGVVAIATVSNCQLRFGLISKKVLFHLAATVALGAGLFIFAKSFFFREAAEILALLPVLPLAWHWYREFNPKRSAAVC
jgi:O-antigen/teichoic acid export membrane protein